LTGSWNPKKTFWFLGTWLLSIAAVRSANAESFQIINRQYGNLPTAAYATMDTLFDQLASSINQNLPDIDVTNYLQGIANAMTLASAGIGSDYATPYKVGMLGVQLGAGIDLGKRTYNEIASQGLDVSESSAGFAAQSSIVVGMTLEAVNYKSWGFTNLKNTRAYLNFFAYETQVENVNLEFRSMGAMIQYNWVRPKRVGRGVLRWGGLDLGTGLKYNSFKAETRINQTQSESTTIAPFGTVTTSFDGTLALGASSYNFSIPIELSSSVRILWIWSLFAGVGADLNLGQTSSITSITGPINVTGTGLTGVEADAFLDLGQTVSPVPVNARIFLGTGIEVIGVNVLVQVTQAVSGSLAGVSLGVRAFW
jgi:hypothetical protein